MKLRTAIIVGVAASGLLLLAASRSRRKNLPRITTADLGYQERSPQELQADNLLDLNTASHDELLGLVLDSEMCDRIIENRPYRNKLDLLSRMVISEPAYRTIRDQIGIARATEAIKVAG